MTNMGKSVGQLVIIIIIIIIINIFHGRIYISYSTKCKHRTDATVYTVQIWLVLVISLQIPRIKVIIIIIIGFFSCGAAAQRGPWTPHSRGFLITHNDAPQSVGLLCTSDQFVAETST